MMRRTEEESEEEEAEEKIRVTSLLLIHFLEIPSNQPIIERWFRMPVALREKEADKKVGSLFLCLPSPPPILSSLLLSSSLSSPLPHLHPRAL
jgi:hypothetical protein